MAEIWHVTKPKARKAHVCDQCGRTIEPGETYHRGDGFYDGMAQTSKVCAQCYRLMADLWAIDVYGEDAYGIECYAYLPEVDWDDVRDGPPVWAAREAAWRSKWVDRTYPEEVPRG